MQVARRWYKTALMDCCCCCCECVVQCTVRRLLSYGHLMNAWSSYWCLPVIVRVAYIAQFTCMSSCIEQTAVASVDRNNERPVPISFSQSPWILNTIMLSSEFIFNKNFNYNFRLSCVQWSMLALKNYSSKRKSGCIASGNINFSNVKCFYHKMVQC